jgi:hypothetical protein
LNPHALRRRNLNPVRLPIPPLVRCSGFFLKFFGRLGAVQIARARGGVHGARGSARIGGVSDADEFKHCSTCKKPIRFEGEYFQCSVSTCNRKKLGMFFCTLECWDAHVPMMRHREAWAEKVKAPTRAAWLAEEGEAAAKGERESESEMNDDSEKRRRIVAGASAAEVPKEVLVVVSKLKAYVKARSGMNTSDTVVDLLSDQLRRWCDAAIDHATRDGRKTILDRDFRA